MFFRIDGNGAAPGFVRNLVRHSAIPAARVRIGHQQNVHDGVRALRGFDGFFQAYFAAFVLRVGDDDDGFATGLGIQLFVAREIDGVVERGPGDLPRTDRPRVVSDAPGRWHVDARFANGTVELAAIIGEIRQKV